MLKLFHLLNNDNNANAKKTKNSTNTKKATNKKKDENKNILLEYMGDVDDKLFKEYSNGKNFNSFINEFDRATNEEDKEKVVKELKDINGLNHDIERDENSEYRSKLFDIVNAIDYFLYEYSKKEPGLKILTPNQIFSRLSISLAQLKAGNNSEKLKNEIRQLLYSLYRSKKLTRNVYNNLINTI